MFVIMKRILKLVVIGSAALALLSCQRLENLKHYYDTHMVFGESAGFSFIPGVLAERSDDRIILEFDSKVDDGILDLLRLTGYTEKMPAELPESLPDARFVLDRENGNRVILDVSLLDRSTPIPVTLIYDNKTEPVLAHIMLSEEPSPDKLPGGGKSYSAVISDIHLNDYRSQQGGWAWFDKNRDYLINFLDRLIENKEKYRELVLLGDIVDEIVTPVPGAAFARPDGTAVTEKEYIGLIADANSTVLEKFRELQEEGIKLIYVPGNHDGGLDEEDAHKLFGPEAVFVSDIRGLGSYVPEYAQEITMEHGHRYDVICAPDRVSNIGIDNVTEESAFMGMQYFVTRIAATHDYLAKQPRDGRGGYSLRDLGLDEKSVQAAEEDNGEAMGGRDEFNLFLTKAIWKVVGLTKHFPGLETTKISTGLNGLTRDYGVSQYSFLGENPAPELYGGMYLQSEWSKRLELNNAPSEFPFLLGTILCEVPYMDVPAINWIARRDPRHRIFIWGHTHNPLMLAKHFDGRQRGYIYANTGSWVDDDVSIYDTRSFVDLYYGNDGYIQVCVKQAGTDGSVKNLYDPLWLKK